MMPLYVPILKGKEGEYGALDELSTASKDAIAPVIEVPSVPYDYANERPAKTLSDHVAPIAERLNKSWAGRELYLDMPWFSGGELLSNGLPAVAHLLHECWQRSVRAVPVLRTTSSKDYASALQRHLTGGGRNRVCVRLAISDFDDEGEVAPRDAVAGLLDAVGASVAASDLILDLGDMGMDVGRATLLARSVLSQLPSPGEWTNVVLAGASFPENLSDVDAATTTRLPRVEWQTWERLRRRPTGERRRLLFGDYGISHPTPAELDPRTMRMSASIRYTTDDSWLVLKGRNVRQFGFDQYFALAKELVALPDYSGENFSWGDRFVALCARGAAGPGNATTWRKVGTNHHLTLVARRLASN
jgi:Beta protein